MTTYAIYKGKQYEAYNSRRKQKIVLISEDEESVNLGFSQDIITDDYLLEVEPSEVERFYKRRHVGEYKGYVFDIVGETSETYTLYSNEPFSLELGFDLVAKFECEKKVSKEEMSKVWWEEEELLAE